MVILLEDLAQNGIFDSTKISALAYESQGNKESHYLSETKDSCDSCDNCVGTSSGCYS